MKKSNHFDNLDSELRTLPVSTTCNNALSARILAISLVPADEPRKLNLVSDQHQPQRCSSGQKSAMQFYMYTEMLSKAELCFWTMSTTAILFWTEIYQFDAHRCIAACMLKLNLVSEQDQAQWCSSGQLQICQYDDHAQVQYCRHAKLNLVWVALKDHFYKSGN